MRVIIICRRDADFRVHEHNKGAQMMCRFLNWIEAREHGRNLQIIVRVKQTGR
jgi:hypothetical protein